MIYLLDGTEFKPSINYVGVKNSIEAKFNMSDIISKKLSLASESNELIHTQWLRGIGKTYELIRFAKRNNYIVFHPNAMVVSERENYEYIYFPAYRFSIKDETEIRNAVVDEGISDSGIQLLKDAGFNIITGFYTPKKESEISFQEKVLSTLKNEIEALTPKLQHTRENGDYGSYKNLINAYKEVLNLIRDFKLK